jgi:hypothetical protein
MYLTEGQQWEGIRDFRLTKAVFEQLETPQLEWQCR